MDACILCKGNSFDKILEFNNHPMFGQKFLSEKELDSDIGINFDVIKCHKCDLVQIGYKENVNLDFYDDEYICATGNSNFEYQKDLASELIKSFSLDSNSKRVIELGCGDGFFSKELMSKGACVYAIEPSGKAFDHAKKLGINVERKYIKDVTDSFDFFVLRQVLEHISLTHLWKIL